jgi:hypothetical protein
VLRSALALTAIAFLFLAPDPGTRAVYHGMGVLATVVMPALAPIVLAVLMLDTMMSLVFASDRRGVARRHLQLTAALEAALVLGLAIAWFPFFRALLSA